MVKTRDFDLQERLIVKELIRNPRISDNQISKRTKIPVMSVNRKRKGLEQEGLISYYASLDVGEHGTGKYEAKQLYIIKYRLDITRQDFLKLVMDDKSLLGFSSSYISQSFLGEKDGHLCYMLILNAQTESKLLDEFSGKLVPFFKKQFGENCMKEIITMRISNTLRKNFNYIPMLNMEKGIIKDSWPDEYIFVDEEREKYAKNKKESTD